MKPLSRILVYPTLLILVTLLSACATSPKPVPHGEEIAITVVPARSAVAWRPIQNKNLNKGAATGATVGVLAGFVVAAGCGPFLWELCAAGTVPVLGSGGLALGAMVGSMQGLGDDRFAALEARLAAYEHDYPPTRQLRDVVTEEFAQRWIVVEGSAPTTVAITLDRVGLQMIGEDRVALALQVTARFEQAGRRRHNPPLVLAHQSPPADVNLWLEDQDRYITESFDRAYQDIAQRLYVVLVQ